MIRLNENFLKEVLGVVLEEEKGLKRLNCPDNNGLLLFRMWKKRTQKSF